MTVLPNADHAFVDIAKLRNYCLNPDHGEGKHKARVFRSTLGFTVEDADKLRDLIQSRMLMTAATELAPSDYGQRYVVDFQIEGLQGAAIIRTSWIIRQNEDFPRLTSCYVL
jgi:hypothetical protein